MKYRVEILRPAQKQLARVTEPNRSQIIEAIRALSEDPRPAKCRRLTGRPAWRIRVGDYRIIYEIHDEKILVLIIAIGHRREIYR